jgi:hypothetical protein
VQVVTVVMAALEGGRPVVGVEVRVGVGVGVEVGVGVGVGLIDKACSADVRKAEVVTSA